MKKVSICIPVYNNVNGVQRLLDSVSKQKFRDFEVIITDDSTNEEVAELVNTYNDFELRYYKNAERLGAIRNWNSAVQKCTGEYIKIMHHDDWFTDEASLGKLVQMLDEKPEAILAFCGTWQVGEGQKYSRHISKSDARLIQEDYRNLYLGNIIGAPSAVIHRKSVCQYDEKLTWLVDMDFYMQLLKENSNFVYTEEPLISIGMGKEQLTRKCIENKEINSFEYQYIYKKYNLEVEQEYKNKLENMLLVYDCSANEVKGLGISTFSYRCKKAKKLMCKVKTKLKIMMNKGNTV